MNPYTLQLTWYIGEFMIWLRLCLAPVMFSAEMCLRAAVYRLRRWASCASLVSTCTEGYIYFMIQLVLEATAVDLNRKGYLLSTGKLIYVLWMGSNRGLIWLKGRLKWKSFTCTSPSESPSDSFSFKAHIRSIFFGQIHAALRRDNNIV